MLQTHPELVNLLVRVFSILDEFLQTSCVGAQLLLKQLISHFVRHKSLAYPERLLLNVSHLCNLRHVLDICSAKTSEDLEFELVSYLKVLPVKVQVLLVKIVEPYRS